MLQAIGIVPQPPRNPGTAGEAAEISEAIDIDNSDGGQATPPPGMVRSSQKITRSCAHCCLVSNPTLTPTGTATGAWISSAYATGSTRQRRV